MFCLLNTNCIYEAKRSIKFRHSTCNTSRHWRRVENRGELIRMQCFTLGLHVSSPYDAICTKLLQKKYQYYKPEEYVCLNTLISLSLLVVLHTQLFIIFIWAHEQNRVLKLVYIMKKLKPPLKFYKFVSKT